MGANLAPASPAAEPVGPSVVLEYAGQRLAKYGVVTVAVAFLLTREPRLFNTEEDADCIPCGRWLAAPRRAAYNTQQCRNGCQLVWFTRAETSGRFWLNLPLAAVAVGALCLAWSHVSAAAAPGDGRAAASHGGSWRQRRSASGGGGWEPAPAAKQDGSRWRDKVRAPVVEQAWETLCGSILQEVRAQGPQSCRRPGIACAVEAQILR